MATFMYKKAKAAILSGDIDLLGDDIKVVLARIGGGHYVADENADQFLSAIISGDRIATTANLASKSVTSGIFDAADSLFSTVSAGPAGGALVIYRDSGSGAASSEVIMYTEDYVGLPVTPIGSDINIAFPNTTNKILALV